MPLRNREENTDLESRVIADDDHDYQGSDVYEKKDVECVCPKCRNSHFMKMHWIGRGTPRKFCQPCRNAYHINDA